MSRVVVIRATKDSATWAISLAICSSYCVICLYGVWTMMDSVWREKVDRELDQIRGDLVELKSLVVKVLREVGGVGRLVDAEDTRHAGNEAGMRKIDTRFGKLEKRF